MSTRNENANDRIEGVMDAPPSYDDYWRYPPVMPPAYSRNIPREHEAEVLELFEQEFAGLVTAKGGSEHSPVFQQLTTNGEGRTSNLGRDLQPSIVNLVATFTGGAFTQVLRNLAMPYPVKKDTRRDQRGRPTFVRERCSNKAFTWSANCLEFELKYELKFFEKRINLKNFLL